MQVLSILYLVLPLLLSPLYAQQSLILTEKDAKYPLGLHLDIIEDREQRWSIEDITTAELSHQFVPSKQRSPSFGFTSSAYWLRFKLRNGAAKEQQWLLEVDRPLLDAIELYIPRDDGSYIRKVAGRQFPFTAREVEHRNFVFHLPVGAEDRIYYLRVESESAMFFLLTIWSAEAFISKDHNEQIALGIYIGIVVSMILYNAFIFISLKDRSYLYYVLYITSFGGFAITIKDGLAYEYLWPTSPWWGKQAQLFFMASSMLWALQFARSFLLTKVHVPWQDTVLSVFMWFAVVQMVMPFFVSYALSEILLYSVISVCIVFVIPVGITCLRKGYSPARYFLIAWSGLFAGLILYFLMAFGVLPSTFVTYYSVQLGSALEVILLSLGLADRVNLLQEQERKQRQLVVELERELQIGHDMQMALMPKENPQVAGLDISGRCIPATHVGGDFFQYFNRNGKLSLALADVTGHAMEAAIPVVMFSGILKSQVEIGGSVEEMFDRLNRSLHGTLDNRTFVCFAMGEFDPLTNLLRLANCGCPYPYHYQAATREIAELQVVAYPLGVRAETAYAAIETRLDTGDYVVFCSDGIIEAGNADEDIFGFEQTAETIRTGCAEGLSAEVLIDRLIGAVQDFAGDTPQGDDMTCVVLRVEG